MTKKKTIALTGTTVRKGARTTTAENVSQRETISPPPLWPPQLHPGLFIKKAMLERDGLTVTEAAEALGVSRITLSTLIHGHASLSGEMALRLELVFGYPMEWLLLMQSAHDIARTRRRAHTVTVPRVGRESRGSTIDPRGVARKEQ